jgi:acyl-CoA oxidase
MFQELMRQMGTQRHEEMIEKCENYEISGCFCMTEMSHGSNTREMKTTAHYDAKTEVIRLLLMFKLMSVNFVVLKEFIINTPSIEDSKVWVGNLGKHATHAAVYAQLYTDGVCHGKIKVRKSEKKILFFLLL